MIPLLKVKHPSNFGPNYWAAKAKIDHYLGRHSVLCSSGTAGLVIALKSLKNVSVVGVPEYTFIGTLQAVRNAGMEFRVLPCRNDGTLDPEQVTGVDAVIVVAPFGMRIDPIEYQLLGLPIVWDFCPAWPQTFSTIWPIVYSTHATKNISCGEGGIVTFPRKYSAEAARRFTCFALDEYRFPMRIDASNYKIDEHRCGILFDTDFDEVYAKIERKKEIIALYSQGTALEPLPNLDYPTLAVFKVPDAERLEKSTDEIIFKRYYYPLLSDFAGMKANENLRNTIAFPSDVTDEELEIVVNHVRKFGV